MGGPTTSDGSSSEEEDANWVAAIESIAATTTFGHKVFGATVNGFSSRRKTDGGDEDDGEITQNPPKPKHYQIKGKRLLDEMLEKSLQFATDTLPVLDNGPSANEGGVRLFKSSSAGIVFDHRDEIQGPTKKPRILPRKDIDQKSKKFKRQLRSIAVDGASIFAVANDAVKKSLARLETKQAAFAAKAKKEEERIAELKKIRGERWLPSIAREMQLNAKSQSREKV